MSAGNVKQCSLSYIPMALLNTLSQRQHISGTYIKRRKAFVKAAYRSVKPHLWKKKDYTSRDGDGVVIFTIYVGTLNLAPTKAEK